MTKGDQGKRLAQWAAAPDRSPAELAAHAELVAGSVHRFFLGPLVTRAVTAAGDELAQEFTRRLGT
ncbi:hypothetical protein OG762_29880 [Streptomyces sp. NBC_01136]|uniref:hypothetical protein n=1 Tax=unclassified Streptomyces TaxID=2593676 RepID=UPI003253E4BC|nr:hypothetical protein OG762_29880 [Streptomyces sp. NBC_01136]